MRIRRKYLFYTLAFASAVIAAIMATVDTVISKLYVQDPWVLGLACFLVGVPISFLITSLMSMPAKKGSIGGKLLDPSFRRIRLVRKNEIKYHVLAGIGNTTLTMGYFVLMALFGDPSVVLPFSQVVILYLLVVESVTEKNVPTISEVQSSVIVTFGAILGSISLSGRISLEALAVVFLVINPGWLLFTTYQRKLKMLRIDERQNDSLNIRFWNVIFGCLFSAIVVTSYDILSGSQYVLLAVEASVNHFDWIALTMTLTFFAYVLYIRALGLGKASVTQAVRSSTIIFVIPFSVLLASLGVINLFSTDPVMLLIKVIGVTLMILGIVSFALTLVKAYVFITVKPGFSIRDTMDKVWDIRGVSRVSACTGSYDIVAKIRTRTLVKGYENIIRRMEAIEGIREYKWESVLKEWEDI
jgi:DNA-binding Lrp family transcriptional regulator